MFAFLRWLYSPRSTPSKSLQYRRRRRLVGRHTSTITALSFSSCGTYLASAGVDGKLVIWSVETGVALHVVHGDAGILAIAWATDSPSQSLLCGVADGTVISVRFDSVSAVWRIGFYMTDDPFLSGLISHSTQGA
jgi:WD40 repeat protein